MPGNALDQSLAANFEEQVHRSPDATAITFEQESISYNELNAAANRLAHKILAHLDADLEPVPLVVGSRLKAIIAIVATLKSGKIYVPLDPTMPIQFLANILADCDPRMIVVDRVAEPVVQSLLEDLENPKPTVVVIEDTDAEKDTSLDLSIDIDSPAQMIYTSGSSGEPKGVLHSHRNIMYSSRIQINAFGYAPEDRFALLLSLSYAMTNAEVLVGLLAGATLCLYDVNQEGLSNLADWINNQRITVMRTVPTMFRQFASMLQGNQQIRDIRLITLGGEPVFGSDIDLMQVVIQPPVYLGVRYGSTEMLFSAWHLHTEETRLLNDIAPLGFPVPGISFILVDDNGQEVPKGEVGEIVIRGQHLALGYWRKPELTASVFRPSPDGNGERLFNTGDLGRFLPNGELVHMGRKGSFVKVRGFRIDPAVIESTLRRHERIQNAHIKIFKDEQSAPKIVAYFIPKQNASITVSALREYLSNQLPDYMIPARFIMLNAFPLTHSGKIDSLLLLEPDRQRPSLDQVYVPPQTDLERQLAEIWSAELGVDEIGMNDNFHDLGGDSLLASSLVDRVNKEFNSQLRLSVLLQCSTVGQMAAKLADASGTLDDDSLLVPMNSGGDRRPFFCIHGLGGGVVDYPYIARLLDQDQPFYGIKAAGHDGETEPDTTIEGMAACCIEAMTDIQPNGPYLIGGYCFGGVVAYEMARQLEAAGEKVGLLGIMEGAAPIHLQERKSYLDPVRMRAIWRNIPYWFEDFKDLGKAKAKRRLRSFFSGASSASKSRSDLAKMPQPQDVIVGDVSHLSEHRLQTISAHIRAMRIYTPGSYDGPVTLFRARVQSISITIFGTFDSTLGWGSLARNINVVEVDGVHRNIHLPPNVSSLALELQRELDRVIVSDT